MPEWVARALQLIEADEPCALVSVLAIEGSTPREAGVRMLVARGTTVGSIGGGNLEYQAIRQASLALDQAPGTWRIQDYPLGPLLAQCCGGRVRVMVERLRAQDKDWLSTIEALDVFGLETRLFEGHSERRLIHGEIMPLRARGPAPKAGEAFCEQIGQPLTPLLMCGAGHVGVAVSKLLQSLPFEVTWLDTREEAQALSSSGVKVVARDQMIWFAEDAKGLVLVLTHDHQLDYELCVAALNGQAPFIGVIGSATKRARFFSRLGKDGFDAAALARLHCPIGLPGLRGKAPEIIAVSVAAQILLIAQNLLVKQDLAEPQTPATFAESPHP